MWQPHLHRAQPCPPLTQTRRRERGSSDRHRRRHRRALRHRRERDDRPPARARGRAGAGRAGRLAAAARSRVGDGRRPRARRAAAHADQSLGGRRGVRGRRGGHADGVAHVRPGDDGGLRALRRLDHRDRLARAAVRPALRRARRSPRASRSTANLRGWLAAGAALVALGAAVRVAGDSFALLMAGTLIAAVAQPLVVNSVTPIAAGYLDERRPAARHRADVRKPLRGNARRVRARRPAVGQRSDARARGDSGGRGDRGRSRTGRGAPRAAGPPRRSCTCRSRRLPDRLEHHARAAALRVPVPALRRLHRDLDVDGDPAEPRRGQRRPGRADPRAPGRGRHRRVGAASGLGRATADRSAVRGVRDDRRARAPASH